MICAVDELLNGPKTPEQIILKEYIDLAGDFFDAKDIHFMNAVSNSLKVKIRMTHKPDDLEQ